MCGVVAWPQRHCEHEPAEVDRLVIATWLMEALPDELPGLSDDAPDFAAELDRRSGDVDGAIPWEQLRDELRQDP